jgi:hypothetical protein
MIDTDTPISPFDLDMGGSKTAVGLRPRGSGWFEQVLRTPSNGGGTHGPGSACVRRNTYLIQPHVAAVKLYLQFS